MPNATKISCPQCSHEFNPEAAIASRIEQELKSQFAEQVNQLHKQHEAKRNEVELELKRIEEMREQQDKLVKEQVAKERCVLENKLKAELTQHFGNDLEILREEKAQMAQKLKDKQEQELLLLRRQSELENRERELELETERRILSMRTELEQKIRQTESEHNELKMKEKDKQIEDMKRLVEEMKRKSEQGSMQLQGEVQELALEEKLQQTFPFDVIQEVGKGVRGADTIQIVRDNIANECGTIIYESKRTKGFSNEWIEKLKTDARAAKADIMVLVTEALPKGMQHFGQYDGVWVCTFHEFIPMAILLRDCLIKIAAANASQENKGGKMQMLYDYLTSTEFNNQFAAVAEGITSLRSGIIKERSQMEKLWKEREKQLDKSLLNIVGMYGAVKGIAGSSVHNVELLETEDSTNEIGQPLLN